MTLQYTSIPYFFYEDLDQKGFAHIPFHNSGIFLNIENFFQQTGSSSWHCEIYLDHNSIRFRDVTGGVILDNIEITAYCTEKIYVDLSNDGSNCIVPSDWEEITKFGKQIYKYNKQCWTKQDGIYILFGISNATSGGAILNPSSFAYLDNDTPSIWSDTTNYPFYKYNDKYLVNTGATIPSGAKVLCVSYRHDNFPRFLQYDMQKKDSVDNSKDAYQTEKYTDFRYFPRYGIEGKALKIISTRNSTGQKGFLDASLDENDLGVPISSDEAPLEIKSTFRVISKEGWAFHYIRDNDVYALSNVCKINENYALCQGELYRIPNNSDLKILLRKAKLVGIKNLYTPEQTITDISDAHPGYAIPVDVSGDTRKLLLGGTKEIEIRTSYEYSSYILPLNGLKQDVANEWTDYSGIERNIECKIDVNLTQIGETWRNWIGFGINVLTGVTTNLKFSFENFKMPKYINSAYLFVKDSIKYDYSQEYRTSASSSSNTYLQTHKANDVFNTFVNTNQSWGFHQTYSSRVVGINMQIGAFSGVLGGIREGYNFLPLMNNGWDTITPSTPFSGGHPFIPAASNQVFTNKYFFNDYVGGTIDGSYVRAIGYNLILNYINDYRYKGPANNCDYARLSYDPGYDWAVLIIATPRQ